MFIYRIIKEKMGYLTVRGGVHLWDRIPTYTNITHTSTDHSLQLIINV